MLLLSRNVPQCFMMKMEIDMQTGTDRTQQPEDVSGVGNQQEVVQ